MYNSKIFETISEQANYVKKLQIENQILQGATREEIERYLKYERGYMFKNRNLAEDVEHVFNATVNRDPYFGVIRMIISRDV